MICTCIIFYFCTNVYASSLIPRNINLDTYHFKNKTAEQIEQSFASLKNEHTDQATLWSLTYQEARFLKHKNTKVFCSNMKDLANQEDFPLRQLALIESYELCPYDDLSMQEDQFPKWLRLRLAQAFYIRHKTFKQDPISLQAYLYLGQHSLDKHQKIFYLKLGLALAKNLGQKNKQNVIKKILYQQDPRLNPVSDYENYFLKAKSFKNNKNYKQALKFYIKVLNSPKTSFKDKNLSFKALAQIYTTQRRRKKIQTNHKQWEAWLLKEDSTQSLKTYYNKKIYLAKIDWNLGNNVKAINQITEFLKNKKSHILKNKALYLRGLIYKQEKQLDLSLQDFNTVIHSFKNLAHKPLLDKALWQRAWHFKNKQDLKQALHNFKLLKDTTKNIYTKNKALFWEAKSLLDLNQTDLAKTYFIQLAEQDSFGYYGLIAKNMANSDPHFHVKTSSSHKLHFHQKASPDHTLYWLMLLNKQKLISHFLRAQKEHVLSSSNNTEQQWLKMLVYWSKTNQHLDVFRSLNDMDLKVKSSFFKKHITLLFPVIFSKEILQASVDWNISKVLLFSIIRQESAFNPRARSPASALGLMQLLPSTARYVSKKFKIPYKKTRDLYKPFTNISLGSAYLKFLLKKYQNSIILSTAAYNAGTTTVDKWYKKNKHMQALEFIENIDYEETKVYVRLIIRNYLFYHNIIHPDSHWFPKHLLDK